jgi:AcrR family transcriptional regulator
MSITLTVMTDRDEPLPRALEILWRDTASSRRSSGLSRERIVAAAVELADADGLPALSMARLAERLGCGTMSLYRHVANKDDLLEGMVDVVYDEARFSRDGGWKSALRERAHAMRQALLRHPWGIGLLEPQSPGPANLRYHNEVAACLREDAGLPFETAIHVFNLMDSYLYGFALQESTLPSDIPAEAEERREMLAGRDISIAEEFPYLAEIASNLQATGFDYSKEFEWGLEQLLGAIERLVQREATRRRKKPSTGS